MVVNRKKLYRLYKEEKLTVRKRGGRKRALGTRAPMTIPQGAYQRWSVDFASDTLSDSRRFCVIDDFTRECLAAIVDNFITGERVARELDNIAQRRGFPLLVGSYNGTEFTSNVRLRWQQDQRVEWHYIAPGKPTSRTAWWRASSGASVMSASTNTCSPATAMPWRSSKTGEPTTPLEDHKQTSTD